MTITFSDGEKFATDGDLRIERRRDGLYLVGHSMLIPIDSWAEGRAMIEEMTRKPPLGTARVVYAGSEFTKYRYRRQIFEIYRAMDGYWRTYIRSKRVWRDGAKAIGLKNGPLPEYALIETMQEVDRRLASV